MVSQGDGAGHGGLSGTDGVGVNVVLDGGCDG